MRGHEPVKIRPQQAEGADDDAQLGIRRQGLMLQDHFVQKAEDFGPGFGAEWQGQLPFRGEEKVLGSRLAAGAAATATGRGK